MSFIGGYQSNVNFNALQLVGDFPIEHSLGGYGVASGTNSYALVLNPVLTEYRAGLPLEVKFTHPNTGPATLNVDGVGAKVIKKIVGGVLADVDAGDLAIYKIYILIYDGVYFQVANFHTGGTIITPPNATEDQRGIAQIATTAEINAGTDNDKIVTPAKLASYVANKLTGLWEDKGLINCATNPNYPAGLVGDAYTVSEAGKIGGPVGLNVAVRAIIYCNADNPGGTQAAVGASWTVIQSSAEQATEAIIGLARIALQAEVNVGADNSTIVSPLKLKNLLDNRLATEILAGLAELATQSEVNTGTDDARIVTPLKLKTFIEGTIVQATQDTLGIAKIATTSQVNDGTDDATIITPAKLAAYVASKVTGLWEDKGTINCGGNPNYPAGQVGDAYTVIAAGKIGGVAGANVGLRDIIYCNANTASGDQAAVGANWTVIQANLEQATESLAGYARIALQAEVNTGTNDTAFVTPLKIKALLDGRSATELLTGLVELATQAEVNTGTDDQRVVTPLKLKTLLTASLVAASEAQAGIAQIASTTDVNNGVDNTRIVTPAKMAAYVASKVTGLWEDKGVIDCSTNPNYPIGQVGDAYTISVAGKIGGPAGPNVGLRDIIYCSTDTVAGNHATVGANWNIIQANLEQASETLAGFARVALQAEVNTGTDNSTFVTPLKLKSLLDGKQATELVLGLIEIATQAEVDAGTDDGRAVTPLKLLTLLNSQLRYKAGTGANSIIPRNGLENIASAAFAAVLNGSTNTASGVQSVAMGFLANAVLFNEFARAGGGFYNNLGSAQNSVISLFNIIPSGALSYPLTLDGNGLSGVNRWRPAVNCLQQFSAHVSIVQNSGTIGAPGDSWSGIFDGSVKNRAGALSWLGGDPVLRDVRQDGGFFPTVEFILNGNEVTIAVDGMVERSLHATVTVFINQTKFSLVE